jgi:hypothetical protein
MRGVISKGYTMTKSAISLFGLGFHLFIGLVVSLAQMERVQASGLLFYGTNSQQSALGTLPTLLKGPHQYKSFEGASTPATLTQSKTPSLSYQVMGARSFFDSTGEIRQSNARIAQPQGTTEFGNVDTDMEDLLLHGLSLSARISKSPEIYLGISALFPVERLALVDSGPAYRPHYALYDNQAQRPHANFGLGFPINDHLSFGAGGKLYTSVNATSEFILSVEDDKTTHAQIEIRAKQKFAPILSLLYAQDDFWASSLTARYQTDWGSKVNAIARIPGSGSSTIPVAMNTVNTLYFEPSELEWASQLKISDTFQILGGVSYQLWEEYTSPRVTVSAVGADPNVDEEPTVDLQNVIVPKLASIQRWNDSFETRVGLAYFPSPFKDLASGDINTVHTDLAVAGLGFGLNAGRPFKMAYPLMIDFHTQYHHLFDKNVEKSGTQIGAPGYKLGGSVIAYGISASTQF